MVYWKSLWQCAQKNCWLYVGVPWTRESLLFSLLLRPIRAVYPYTMAVSCSKLKRDLCLSSSRCSMICTRHQLWQAYHLRAARPPKLVPIMEALSRYLNIFSRSGSLVLNTPGRCSLCVRSLNKCSWVRLHCRFSKLFDSGGNNESPTMTHNATANKPTQHAPTCQAFIACTKYSGLASHGWRLPTTTTPNNNFEIYLSISANMSYCEP